ncbi:2,4'-dihydroxyacetophenone dioxygenase family protein [Streptomyces sp. NPDC001514]|uniref:2,4'-dihydroxyacetophenone dioxygenase family protein n=1 Tax=Streptomyces sp. NPDC002896 TaxID=3154438 RepID=UPI0033285F47
MTAPVSPTVISTYGGRAPLPLVSLPQGELLTVNIDQIPLFKDLVAPGIHIQTLRLDPERGEWVFLSTLAPGVELPIHYHTGTAQVWTIQGRWLYREYPDQPQTAGSYLYEPGGSVHTFYTPEDNTEDTVALAWIEGAQVSFNEDGTFHSVMDAVTLQHLTETAAAAQGTGPVGYIHGGAAGVIKS